MDRYDYQESALSDEHDYYVCMADCPEGKDCKCGGNSGDETFGWMLLGLTILLIVGFVVIFHIVDNILWRIKHNKQYKKPGNKKK